jgi:hypothetical protein
LAKNESLESAGKEGKIRTPRNQSEGGETKADRRMGDDPNAIGANPISTYDVFAGTFDGADSHNASSDIPWAGSIKSALPYPRIQRGAVASGNRKDSQRDKS